MTNNNFYENKSKISVLQIPVAEDRDEPKGFVYTHNDQMGIDLYRWDIRESSCPARHFDLIFVTGKNADEVDLSGLKKALNGVQSQHNGLIPVVGMFRRIDSGKAVTLLKDIFCDVRKMPRTAEKMAKYITLWLNYVNRNMLGKLKRRQLKHWKEKNTLKESWLNKEIFNMQAQLFRIQHSIDSMEMWQRGRRLDRELKIAHSIQSILLPAKLPSFAGFDFDAVCLPAREVGGDFYDCCCIDENRLGFVIGDVATRGIPAALLMAGIRGMWRSLMLNAVNTCDIVSQINSLICDDLQNMWGMYITLFCGIVDRSDGTLMYTNAGHCYPVVYRKKTGCLEELKIGGQVVGIHPDITYEQATVQMNKKDMVIAYTDGITESHTGRSELFGKEKLYEIIKKNSRHSVKYIREIICREIDDFMGISEHHDDKALFLFKKLK